MPFEYTEIEDEIVALLQSKLAEGFVIIALPEKEKDFQRTSTNCLITVAFSDSQFNPPVSMDLIKQTETVTVLLNIRSAKLRGDFSINQALQLVKIALVGFKPSNLSKLWLQKIEFDERDINQNYFSYNIMFAGTKLNFEIVKEVQGPLLKTVTFNDHIQLPE